MLIMIIYNFLYYGFWRVLEKICLKLHVFIFIKTLKGIKNVNIDNLYGDDILEPETGEIFDISPSKLFLSVDYLKDNYTLLDCCLIDSPHYGFVSAINSGQKIQRTEYYQRFIKGYLDGRHCQRTRDVSYFFNKNEKAKQDISCGSYKPVSVYFWKGRYYICDGKHRAALCAYLNKDVRCVLVPSISGFKESAIHKEIYRIMLHDKDFSKHIEYLNYGEK